MSLHYLNAGTLLFLSMLLVACDQPDAVELDKQTEPLAQAVNRAGTPPEPIKVSRTDQTGAIELEWDDLIPADWRLETLMEKYDISNLSDDDPRASEVFEEIKKFWEAAPVVHDHDGKLIRLPGFVVPLDVNRSTIQEFLLVPYYGACIHTPPPPANQTVYVVMEDTKPYEGKMFDTVWVTGQLRVEQISSELGTAGYRIDATMVKPYE